MTLSERQKGGIAIGAGAGLALLLALLPRKAAGASARVAALTLDAAPSSGIAPLDVVLSGAATDAHGNPVQGAALYFSVNGAREPGYYVTDASGVFEFGWTFGQAGTYECTISANPSAQASSTVTV